MEYKYLMSVILPTRKRVEPLKRAIGNLIDLADEPEKIEILLKVDSDDQETIDILPTLPDQVKSIVYPRFRGYADLHIFANDLARISQGKWLWGYNDDCILYTKGWDTIIKEYGDKFLIINADSNTGHPCFPIFPRKLFEWWGHLSLARQVDSWINVCSAINITIDEPRIKMKHDIDMENITTKERDYDHSELLSPELTHIREVVDLNILKKNLGIE